MTDVQIM